MHPSSALIVWLAAVLAVQFVGYSALGLLVLAIVISLPKIVHSWLGYCRRARWLLLSLWLILAYNTPGEAFQDMAWAPTYEGIADANLQAVRVILMLGCLAWLFGRLGRDGLVSALWGALQPLQGLGLETSRLVVRLSLVLENLQAPMENGAWRKMLSADESVSGGLDSMKLSLPVWAMTDTFVVLAAVAALLGAIVL
ncbi:MAG: hypothetical protein Q8S26_14605 [Azonexus sp.]|nr:hypothetical protein [Azonexus sp.]